MRSPTRHDLKLSSIVRELMEEHNLDTRGFAARCGVTYQTIKNVLDGGSVNRRFISELIRQFDIEHDSQLNFCTFFTHYAAGAKALSKIWHRSGGNFDKACP